jgi:hypothetical protein
MTNLYASITYLIIIICYNKNRDHSRILLKRYLFFAKFSKLSRMWYTYKNKTVYS